MDDVYRCLFFNDTATTEIYTYGHTLSLHDALPIWSTTISARSRPRRTVLPCRIIISSVTPRVDSRPCSTMPRLSPTRTMSQHGSTSSAIGVVLAVRHTSGVPPLCRAISGKPIALVAAAVTLMSFAFPPPELAFAEVLKGGDGQGQTLISLGHISRADLSGGKLEGANDIRAAQGRSEGRRGGKAWVSQRSSSGSPY